MKEKSTAIILKTIKLGESDLICRLLTSQGAKMSLVAKAALKSKKRFGGGVLQATHVVEAQYSFRKSSDSQLGLLAEAHLIEDFPELRKSYDHLQLAFYLLQAAEKVSQEGSDSPQIYNLLGNALKALTTDKGLEELRLHFQIKLLYAQGVFRPDPWQYPYLEKSIQEKLELQVSGPQRQSVELAMETYLKTAEAESLFFDSPRN